jgi:rhodanese-related sulfurtransferase
MRRAVILRNALMMAILSNTAMGFAPIQREASPGKTADSAKRKVAHPEVPRMAAIEVKQLIAKKADIVLIDTQPAENYEMWHIPTAINIPYIATANPTDREMMLVALPLDKTIVLYCPCEEGTDSARMALELRRLGYDPGKVKVLEGGLIMWNEAGYPMIKTEAPE